MPDQQLSDEQQLQQLQHQINNWLAFQHHDHQEQVAHSEQAQQTTMPATTTLHLSPTEHQALLSIIGIPYVPAQRLDAKEREMIRDAYNRARRRVDMREELLQYQSYEEGWSYGTLGMATGVAALALWAVKKKL